MVVAVVALIVMVVVRKHIMHDAQYTHTLVVRISSTHIRMLRVI